MLSADKTVNLAKLPAPVVADDRARSANTSEEVIALIFRTGRVVLPLPEGDEITLGRVHFSNKIQPDVDLSAFGGGPQGTSRLHAAIRRKNNKIWIEDTGSSNGTWIDGERLAPFTPHPLSGNCHVMLADLEIQLIISDRGYLKPVGRRVKSEVIEILDLGFIEPDSQAVIASKFMRWSTDRLSAGPRQQK